MEVAVGTGRNRQDRGCCPHTHPASVGSLEAQGQRRPSSRAFSGGGWVPSEP